MEESFVQDDMRIIVSQVGSEVSNKYTISGNNDNEESHAVVSINHVGYLEPQNGIIFGTNDVDELRKVYANTFGIDPGDLVIYNPTN